MGWGGKETIMKQKDLEKTLPFEMNLQFYAEEGDGAGAENDNGGGTDNDGGEQNDSESGTEGKEPTFDELLKGGHQAEFDRRVQQAINTALSKQKTKYEALMDDKLSEAEKLAKMTKEEKADYMQKKRIKELEDREAAVTRKELEAEAKNTLAERKLPTELSAVLNYKDADSCKTSIETVEKAFQKAVEAAVEEKLKGGRPSKKAPEGGDTDLAVQVEALMRGY